MKILSLIYGTRGLLGKHLVAECKRRGDRVEEIDVPVDQMPSMADRVVGSWHGIRVFNAVGLASVDHCEKHPDEAFRVNSLAAQLMSRMAKMLQASMVHISTEYVFDANGHINVSEAHTPNPGMVYAQSKRYGEILVEQENRYHQIVRLQQVYGDGGRNFLSKLATGKLIEGSLDNERVIAPMWAGTAARLIYDIAATNEWGIWHAATRNRTTMYEFASKIRPEVPWQPTLTHVRRPSIHLVCRRWEMNQMDDLPTWEESYEAFKASR